MNFQLQLVFIVASIITFLCVIRLICKNGLNIEDSIVWILWSILLLIMSFFPVIPQAISQALGFMSTSNFVLCVFIFFLYVVVFFQMVTISRLKEKQKELIQKLSLKSKKISVENDEGNDD